MIYQVYRRPQPEPTLCQALFQGRWALIETPGIIGNCVREVYDKANRALYSLLMFFSEQRSVPIEIEDKPLGTWLREVRFCHRVHIRVTPR